MKNNLKLFFLLCGLSIGSLFGCAVFLSPSDRVTAVLNDMNQAYAQKDPDKFMAFVADDFDGNRDDLKIAVENDFAGFVTVDFTTSVYNVEKNEATGRYRADVFYSKTAKSPRFGVYNAGGKSFLEFVEDKNGSFKLYKMSDPALYGLIKP